MICPKVLLRTLFKAAGREKRRNISGQARSLVRVSLLRTNDLCYDLAELAKLVM